MNFLWGGVQLARRPLSAPVTVSFEPGFLALVFGALAIGFYLSLHFGKGGRDPKADDAVRAPNTGRRSGA